MGIYTDLAREAREIHPDIPGIKEEEENVGDVNISRIQVISLDAANQLQKPMGMYITIEAPKLVERDTKVFEDVSKILSNEINRLLPDDKPDQSILVVGLGNRGITADALGPRVIEHIFVTRHITAHLPDIIGQPMRSVAAVAPGVLGTTGVETLEMLRGLVERVKPYTVIAIDALASRRANRISTAIQLTNTGIHPGAGVGNHRLGLTQETLGVPVIALGVPTVVYASTITQDTIELIAETTGSNYDIEQMLHDAQQVISEHFGPMIVTPKDIDTIVTDMANILSGGLNIALHKPYYTQIEELLA
ncbi:GPR endopeptidase [Christensenellaceae bacterium OttesenSCG-928-M15]|nr:GPR endopeptidase [Christensenellaceae bacterium OttesenSCG-928-M15]